jgi:2-polyprenyl-3-methyl-5-hydroxy-6-metoxy-1,4-benzoquinol methylase
LGDVFRQYPEHRGEKILTVRSCICCGGTHFGEALPTDGGIYFRCLTCNSIAQDAALMGVEHLRIKFEEEQSRFYGDDSVMLSSGFEYLQNEATLKRLSVIKAHLKHGDVFEVGPGNGKVMALLTQNGYKVDAIEHSEILARAVEDVTGLAIQHGDFDTFVARKSYDAYMSFHVIEHVPDIISHLTKAAEITKTGGLAFIATPHARSLEHMVSGALAPNYSTAHLQLFSRDGLKHCLERTGWTLVAVYTPEYPTSWLRVITSLLRQFRGRKNAKPRGAYAAAASTKTIRAIKIFAVVSWPLRKIQQSFNLGNELFIVARKL